MGATTQLLISEWAVCFPYIPIYIAIFPENEIERLKDLKCHAKYSFILNAALVIAYVYDGAADAQVSVR